MIDLAVVGGGPAGLATALYAVRAGLSVVVLEARSGPVDKACGEGVMPGGLRRLTDLGVDPPGRDLRGIRYLDGARSAEAHFPGTVGRGVRRTVLHAALLAAAASAGVAVEEHRVRRVEPAAGGVQVDGLVARYVVAADGLHSPVRRALGLDAPGSGRRRFGLRRHVGVAPWTDLVEVHWAPTAEAYVTPVGPGEVGVAVLSSVRAPYAEQLAAFPRLRERLGGEPTSAVRGAGPLRQGARRRVHGRVLLVGDAGGYVDALTGEGLTLALAQAEAAVDAIRADRPVRYERSWRRIGRSYRLLTEVLVRGTGPQPVRRLVVPAAAHVPGLFHRGVRAIARPV